MFDRIKKIIGDTQQPSQVDLKEFTDMTYELIELMVEFTLYSLRTITKKRGAPMT